MILQALYDYYQRKAADPESGIEPEGFKRERIPFLIVIDRNGKFVTIEDTRSGEGKKLSGKPYLVPRGTSRSGVKAYETAHLLWDHVGYVLGVPKSTDSKDVKLAGRQHGTWLRALEILPQGLRDLPEVEAMREFYRRKQVPLVLAHAVWPECRKIPGCLLAFRIDGALEPVPASAEVFAFIRQGTGLVDRDGEAESDALFGRCLVTGEQGPIKRTHGKTAISKDSNALVSFQKNSGYDSYYKEQAYNAPVSVAAEFAYTTALNTLLASSRNRLQVGGTITVFWSERRNAFEDAFASFFGMPPKDDPDRDVEAVRSLYNSIDSGATSPASTTCFFVLGLAPSAFRIAVQFWHQGTVGQLAGRIRQHFDDLEIVRRPEDNGQYSLFWLLVALATELKIDNIPPNLPGSVVRAVLDGTPYPATLLQQAIRRIRVPEDQRALRLARLNAEVVMRMRAAILKATLNRFHRTHPTSEKEITVSLDPENANSGYRLGRLFAVLEKIQEDANPGINATIRERFYGAASASPVSVFPQLLKLKNHHLKKLGKPGLVIAHERRLGEIFSGLPCSMPSHLSMDDQARFAIGYYHQRQALFTKATAIDSRGSTRETES